jgi:hypothetical protein
LKTDCLTWVFGPSSLKINQVQKLAPSLRKNSKSFPVVIKYFLLLADKMVLNLKNTGPRDRTVDNFTKTCGQ